MKYEVIGIMSGTSVDGLDIADCRFTSKNGKWAYEISHAQSISYSDKWKSKLLDIISLSGDEILAADIEFGKFIADRINRFIRKHDVRPDLIASHGHTVFHQPERKITLQIGNGYVINKITGIPTITRFRELDVILGGQGAPLVPIGDRFLFPGYDACLNLGGFSNISYEKGGKRLAYDISPVNILLNRFARKLGSDFDNRGSLARSGKEIESLFSALNRLGFYKKNPPKSLGLEWVNEQVLPLTKRYRNDKDILRTLSRHIAFQIDRAVRNIPTNGNTPLKVLVTGGGAYNDYLIELMRKESGGRILYEIPDRKIIDYKEALIFAFLGLLRYLGEINTLKSVTGAESDSSGGILYDQF